MKSLGLGLEKSSLLFTSLQFECICASLSTNRDGRETSTPIPGRCRFNRQPLNKFSSIP